MMHAKTTAKTMSSYENKMITISKIEKKKSFAIARFYKNTKKYYCGNSHTLIYNS